MKVIFLDIDGVLNTENGIKKLTKNWTEHLVEESSDQFGIKLCPEAVKCLGEIIKATGAKIVISSTWRADGLEKMQEMWKHRNLPAEVIDITGYDEHRVRGREIESWLQNKGWYRPLFRWSAPAFQESIDNCEIESYLIIDDDRDIFIDQAPHFLNTPTKAGLAENGKVEEAIKILNNTDL